MSKTEAVSRRSFVASAVSGAAATALPGMATGEAQQTGEEKVTTLTPYLLFDGNCQQAMEFYQHCFGGELRMMTVKDSPMKDQMPTVLQEKILNAQLKSGRLEVSASDWMRPDRSPARGNTLCLYLSGGTHAELKEIFARLSKGAEVTDPLKEMFFGTYGALNDQFGVRWMFQANKA